MPLQAFEDALLSDKSVFSLATNAYSPSSSNVILCVVPILTEVMQLVAEAYVDFRSLGFQLESLQ